MTCIPLRWLLVLAGHTKPLRRYQKWLGDFYLKLIRTFAPRNYRIRQSSFSARADHSYAALEPRYFMSANDQISEAIYLGTMTEVRSYSGEAISYQTDVDMFSFDVSVGQKVSIDIDRLSNGGGDPYIRLFASSGTQLAANDDAQAPGESFSLESYLEYTFTQAGQFFVGVSGYPNLSYDPLSSTGDVNGSIVPS